MAMTFDVPRCTVCGELARGMLEQVPGIALLIFDEHDTAEYAGETELAWNDQAACRDGAGWVTLECPSGHQWQARPTDVEPVTEEKATPTYEVQQYVLHVMKYRVAATSTAEAIAKLFQGEAELVCQDREFIEVAEDLGLPVDEYPELTAALRQLGVMRGKGEVIPSIRSVKEA